MILFNELYLDIEKRQLVIKASILKSTNYTNVYLDTIEVCNQDNYNTATGTMTNPYTETLTGNNKSYTWKIDIDMPVNPIGTVDDIFFIKVYSKGLPSPATPCGEDIPSILGVCYDECRLYRRGIEETQLNEDPCNPSNDFRDYILHYFAFKTNMIAGNFPQAILIWKNLFNRNIDRCHKNYGCGCASLTSYTSCGCHH